MLQPREKFIVAAVPSGIFLIAFWFLWLSPRLMLHGTVGGDWSDFSSVRHDRVGEDSVVSFRVRTNEALQSMIDRLEFHGGVRGGNTDEISGSLLLQAGYDPRSFKRYVAGPPDLLFLYVDSDRGVLVKINY